jgi:hypothetical protein
VESEEAQNRLNALGPLPWIFSGCVLLGVFAIWLFCGLQGIRDSEAREEVLDSLARIGKVSEVRVNGEAVENPPKVIRAFATLDDHTGPGHSSPTNPFTVTFIGARGTLRVQLARNSERPTDYHVHDLRRKGRTGVWIGCIHTTVFDEYQRKDQFGRIIWRR